MAYKTILVHFNDKKRVSRIVGAAVELAGPSAAATCHILRHMTIPELTSH